MRPSEKKRQNDNQRGYGEVNRGTTMQKNGLAPYYRLHNDWIQTIHQLRTTRHYTTQFRSKTLKLIFIITSSSLKCDCLNLKISARQNNCISVRTAITDLLSSSPIFCCYFTIHHILRVWDNTFYSNLLIVHKL